MTFDVKAHLIRVQGGRDYLPVAWRLVWFRMEHPDWGIETKPVAIEIGDAYAIYHAAVYNAEGKLMGTGTNMETARGFPDYVEKAETGAIGRALAVCGYGTQFEPELDSGGRFSDTPMPGSPATDGGSTAGELVCAECGKAMTKGQFDYSVRAFGSGLCPVCQKAKVAK